MVTNGVHRGCSAGDGATAEIVAVREAAGQDREIGSGGKRRIGVPDLDHLRAGEAQGAGDVTVAVGAGKDDDRGAHQTISIS